MMMHDPSSQVARELRSVRKELEKMDSQHTYDQKIAELRSAFDRLNTSVEDIQYQVKSLKFAQSRSFWGLMGMLVLIILLWFMSYYEWSLSRG